MAGREAREEDADGAGDTLAGYFIGLMQAHGAAACVLYSILTRHIQVALNRTILTCSTSQPSQTFGPVEDPDPENRSGRVNATGARSVWLYGGSTVECSEAKTELLGSGSPQSHLRPVPRFPVPGSLALPSVLLTIDGEGSAAASKAASSALGEAARCTGCNVKPPRRSFVSVPCIMITGLAYSR